MLYQLDDSRVERRGECFIAPNATVIGKVVLGDDVSIWFNAVLRGDNDTLRIGDGSNVQDNAVLHTDPGIELVVGRDCTIGHMVMLHGCTIGDGTLVGIKAVVLNRAKIGKNCLIGANALVTEGKEIPDRSLVLGSPGKVVRQLTDEEVQGLYRSAHGYVEHGRNYRRALQAQA